MSIPITVLFARADSIYKSINDCQVYDAARDALTWPGNTPIVAHPPCRAWSKLRHFARPTPGERELAPWAVSQVREHGGVLEHPAGSALWKYCQLPAPGQVDQFGGWTLGIIQGAFGHRAEKRTLLYIVGITPHQLPAIPYDLNYASHVIETRKRHNHRPAVTKAEREQTPPMLAHWLVELARRCGTAAVKGTL